MQAEVKDAFWALFDTEEVKTKPSPELVELVDRRITEMAARYSATLWVPNIMSPYATWAYSRIRPPSRSLRRTRTFGPIAGGRSRPAGELWHNVRCGR
jgi:hypothetical protein